jgi:hypothetical protein
MNIKLYIRESKQLLGILCLACFAISGQVRAAIIDPVTFLPANSPIQFKYNNFENQVSKIGDVLSGIVNVTSIGSGISNYWASDILGSQLTGIFKNLTVFDIQPVSGGQNIYFSGGTLELFNVAAGTFDPTKATVNQQVCNAVTCPAAWLTFDFVPGVVASGTPAQMAATLFSAVSALTSPFTGTGDGLLKVTGGTAASFFGPNMSLQSNLQSCPAPGGAFDPNCAFAGGYPVASFDPVTGVTVPEPGILFLMGIGLAGLAWRSRSLTLALTV